MRGLGRYRASLKGACWLAAGLGSSRCFEGEFPDLVADVHGRLIGRGYDFVIELFRRILAAHGRSDDDIVALAAIALVHFREDEAIYGKTPASAPEDDFIRVWADTWTTILASTRDD